jgi:hypothetical protein
MMTVWCEDTSDVLRYVHTTFFTQYVSTNGSTGGSIGEDFIRWAINRVVARQGRVVDRDGIYRQSYKASDAARRTTT